MNEEEREYSPKRFAISSVACPACHAKLAREAKWCEGCGFSGAKSMEMFGDTPPPLLPILDVADLWDAKGQRKIEAEVKAFGKRFPQIRWRICAVALGSDVSLPLFGFWLMNASPLLPGESGEDREWTVLLLVDSDSGKTTVTTGYRAEVWLSDEMWGTALEETVKPFSKGHPDKAVVLFLRKAKRLFEFAWRRSQKQLSTK
ncbi:MAG: TPM domain-containing protein [Luteolibacter sp.]